VDETSPAFASRFVLDRRADCSAACDHSSSGRGCFARRDHDHWHDGYRKLPLCPAGFYVRFEPGRKLVHPPNCFSARAFFILAIWNTASISDGDYILRLRVNLTDGTFQEVTVPIKVQNDTPISTPTLEPETATPDSITVQIPTPFLLAASPTPTEVPRPTPSALPINPVSLNQNEILMSLGRGALVIMGLFIFAGLIIRVRRS